MKSLLCTNRAKLSLTQASNSETLVLDLNLKYIFDECSRGDVFIAKAVREVILSTNKPDIGDIYHRQEVLKDFLRNEAMFCAIYAELTAGLSIYDEAFRKTIPAFSRASPVTVRIRNLIRSHKILLECIERINKTVDLNMNNLACAGARDYFSDFRAFYSDEFIREAYRQLDSIALLAEKERITLSAGFGYGMKTGNMIVRKTLNTINNNGKDRKRINQITLSGIAIQEQANSLRDGALLKLHRIITDITDKTLKQLKDLCFELAFYFGGANLYNTLKKLEVPIVFPKPRDYDNKKLCFSELVDISLALSNRGCPVGNSLEADAIPLILVTGANQGGKSTFLRSIGLAQLMMQCGLFVSAGNFTANCCEGIYTHFCHSDNSNKDNGRLDGELKSMSEIIKHIGPFSMVLMNESFSSASEKEASALAGEIIHGLYTYGIETIFVTHIYGISKEIEDKKLDDTLFLMAKRNDDGSRPFEIVKASPLDTSYGLDIYNEVFGYE